MSEKIMFLKNKFQNKNTGEDVEGITIIVDGTFQQVLDKLIRESNGKYTDYASVLQQAVFQGINDMIRESGH